MNDEQNIWYERQRVYDKWFPTIVAILIVVLGVLVNLIISSNKKKPDVANSVNLTTTSPVASISAAADNTESDQTLINLKTATETELEALPGIGQKKAQQIVALRDEGKINEVADLKQVSGISDKLYEGVKDQLTWE